MTIQFTTSPNVSFCTTGEKRNQRNISFYARKQLLLSARLSRRNSVRLFVRSFVRLSVCHTGESGKNGPS